MKKNKKTEYFKRMKNIKNDNGEKFTSVVLSSNFNPDELKGKKEKLTSFFLDENYVPMSFKQMKDILCIENKDIEIFKYILNELNKENVIYLDELKKYVVVSSSDLYECTYELASKSYGYAIVKDESIDDIYVSKELSMNAMDNDEVLVKIIDDVKYQTKNSGSKKVGKVVKIIKRSNEKIVGRYIKSENFGFVEPLNNKIDDIYISKKNNMNAKDGAIVTIDIIKYKTETSKSEGKIIKIIGNKDIPDIEVKGLYESYDLDENLKFNDLIQKELINMPDEVLNEEKVGRIDKTNDRIYTIDSEDAKDLDDAVSVKKDGDCYILSVCIADVSHYVKAGSQLDKEAILRGTSVYIPGTVIPMLPKKLSNGICSLNAGVERLALGIDLKIDKNGKVLDSNIYKAVIKVTKKMSYEKVYKVIVGNDKEALEEYKEYINDIFLMKELAQILKQKRLDEGSLDFDLPETKVILDDNSKLLDIQPYQITIANNIVEEFMLVANMNIAERFYFLQAPFIYRVHEKPDEEKLRDLNEVLSNYHVHIKGIKDIHTKAIADVLNNFKDEESKSVISKLCLRTLKLARYSDECIGHFGLAMRYYCHFTSPIRRYPDLFIHRVISDYIDNKYILDDKKIAKYAKQAKKYAESSSKMEKQATKIERDFDALYETMYMKDKIGQVYDCVVSSITQFGMFVKLDNTIEGMIPFTTMDDYYDFDDKSFRLIGKKTGKIYKIGDKLNVKVLRADIRTRQIDFSIIGV